MILAYLTEVLHIMRINPLKFIKYQILWCIKENETILSLSIYSFKYGSKYTFMSLAVLAPETLNIMKADLYTCLNVVIKQQLNREASSEQHLLLLQTHSCLLNYLSLAQILAHFSFVLIYTFPRQFLSMVWE